MTHRDDLAAALARAAALERRLAELDREREDTVALRAERDRLAAEVERLKAGSAQEAPEIERLQAGGPQEAPDDSVDRLLRSARELATRKHHGSAFEALKRAAVLAGSHPDVDMLLSSLVCPRCGVPVHEPSATRGVDYARFWRGRCPRCEAQLEIR